MLFFEVAALDVPYERLCSEVSVRWASYATAT